MTTFTSDDREEAYKKIVEAAPFQPGYEDAVPIPFAGWVNAAPPHIVDSGASVMIKELSDDEILQQALFSFGNESENFDDSYWIGFARAILRKASEK